MADSRRTQRGWLSARWLGRAWLSAVILVLCESVLALNPDVPIADLRRTTWGAKEGAPSAVSAIAQTSDGYLWLANSTGLTRFDGRRFEHVDLPRSELISSASVMSLLAPPSGGLWIGFTFGGVALLRDGKLTVYGERDGLPPGSVFTMAMDHDGAVWAATNSGLAKLQDSRWRLVGTEHGLPDRVGFILLVDSSGTLWTVTATKTRFLPRGDTTFREGASHAATDAIAIAESPQGEVWVSIDDRLQQMAKSANSQGRAINSGFGMAFDVDGNLWSRDFAGGVTRIPRPERASQLEWLQGGIAASDAEVRLPHGRSASPVVFVDREGNVWTPSATGLTRISERTVRRHLQTAVDFTPYGLSLAAADTGALWVGSRDSHLTRLHDGKVTQFEAISQTSCAFRASDGSLWLGGKAKLWKVTSRRFDVVALPPGTEAHEVQAITEDRDAGLWVSIVRNGVFRLVGGVWTAYGGIDGLPRLTAVTLSTDAKGRVWFGYTEGRVAVLDGAAVQVFADAGRLPVGNVTAVHAKRSHIWAGGEFGLALLDGAAFRAVNADAGINLSSITGIVETSAGDLWLATGAGIVHFSTAEIRRTVEDANYRPRAEVFDSLHGVEGSFARLRPLPTAIEGTDGQLWFVSDAGLYSIDSEQIRRNPVPPPVVIESLIAGDKTYKPEATVTLDKGTTSLRIGYVGLSLTMAEKVRYRYQMEGIDAGWQDAQDRREVLYTDLRPGTHRFHVRAANNDGVWNDTGASLDVVIPPTFVQTGWFMALLAIGAVLFVWLLVWLRVRQVAARMRLRFAERMAERERIARELHDTLLQSTQGLILRFQAVANRIAPSDPSRELIDEALTRADAVMSEGRDRVLDLRVSAEPAGPLPQAIAATGEELAEGRHTAFRVFTDGRARELQPVAKDEMYRIAREALINAFRHAEAASIEVHLVYADDVLTLRIGDDGSGMDPGAFEAHARPDHWGLQGMRERAKRLGARLDIWSRPGAGTEIELKVPATVAYREGGRSRGWIERWLARAAPPSSLY